MMQVVRRRNLPSSFTAKSLPFLNRKLRFLEVAFVMLASANLFVLASAAAFYFFVRKH